MNTRERALYQTNTIHIKLTKTKDNSMKEGTHLYPAVYCKYNPVQNPTAATARKDTLDSG